jgi:nucleoside-diphosphate-sugar epimerase
VRIFLAGATGVIGVRLVPLLVSAGHEVAGLTRSPAKREALFELGAHAVVADVYDAAALRDAVVDFGPELVLHELTDLPDDLAKIGDGAANARIRREGTRNLLAAARAAEAPRFVAQSVAWELPGPGAASRDELEAAVLEGLAMAAGLTPAESFDISWPYVYADEDALTRSLLSAGGVGDSAGSEEGEVRTALIDVLAPFRAEAGGYRLENTWHFLIATA